MRLWSGFWDLGCELVNGLDALAKKKMLPILTMVGTLFRGIQKAVCSV